MPFQGERMLWRIITWGDALVFTQISYAQLTGRFRRK